MDSNLEIGDTARLKRGGALMVAQRPRADDYVERVWHDGTMPCHEI